MKITIALSRGVEGHVYLERQPQLLKFPKGSKKEKEDLKLKNPTLYDYFSEIWQVRNNHVDESLPLNCVYAEVLW